MATEKELLELMNRLTPSELGKIKAALAKEKALVKTKAKSKSTLKPTKEELLKAKLGLMESKRFIVTTTQKVTCNTCHTTSVLTGEVKIISDNKPDTITLPDATTEFCNSCFLVFKMMDRDTSIDVLLTRIKSLVEEKRINGIP